MAIKFPLEMKDGIQVRTLSELKENFDIEKAVGYFLDGKLKSWLDARYYEDESEAISILDEKEPELARKICEIFNVEYCSEEIMDAETLAKRNERIAKLKQFTSDEDIIANVDSVAFNQEELADLFDEDFQTIYLCEGEFVIPRSKQNLTYLLVGNPNVSGLPIPEKKEPEPQNEISNCNSEESKLKYDDDKSVPIEIADLVRHYPYAVLDNYVVVREDGLFRIINKQSLKQKILYEENCLVLTKINGNTIMYSNSENKVVVYNIDTNEKRVLDATVYYGTNYARSEDKILFNNDNNILQLLDTNTFKVSSLFRDGNISLPVKSKHYVLNDNQIYFIPDKGFKFSDLWNFRAKTDEELDKRALYCFDIRTNQCKKICNLIDENSHFYICGLHFESDKFYLIAYDKTYDRDDVCIIQYSETTGRKIIFTDSMKEGILRYSHPYVIYVPELSSFPIRLYNIKSNVSMEVARGCGYSNNGSYYINSFSIVDHWLYFDKRLENTTYRVDLENPVSEINVGSALR